MTSEVADNAVRRIFVQNSQSAHGTEQRAVKFKEKDAARTGAYSELGYMNASSAADAELVFKRTMLIVFNAVMDIMLDFKIVRNSVYVKQHHVLSYIKRLKRLALFWLSTLLTVCNRLSTYLEFISCLNSATFFFQT